MVDGLVGSWFFVWFVFCGWFSIWSVVNVWFGQWPVVLWSMQAVGSDQLVMWSVFCIFTGQWSVFIFENGQWSVS